MTKTNKGFWSKYFKRTPPKTCITIEFASGAVRQYYLNEEAEAQLRQGAELRIVTKDPAAGEEMFKASFPKGEWG